VLVVDIVSLEVALVLIARGTVEGLIVAEGP
jgi:hypothetical protein